MKIYLPKYNENLAIQVSNTLKDIKIEYLCDKKMVAIKCKNCRKKICNENLHEGVRKEWICPRCKGLNTLIAKTKVQQYFTPKVKT